MLPNIPFIKWNKWIERKKQQELCVTTVLQTKILLDKLISSPTIHFNSIKFHSPSVELAMFKRDSKEYTNTYIRTTIPLIYKTCKMSIECVLININIFYFWRYVYGLTHVSAIGLYMYCWYCFYIYKLISYGWVLFDGILLSAGLYIVKYSLSWKIYRLLVFVDNFCGF